MRKLRLIAVVALVLFCVRAVYRRFTPIKINLEELYDATKSDPSAYEHRLLTIAGRINDVDGWPTVRALELRSPDRERDDARAVLRPAKARDAALLRRGDWITLSCEGAIAQEGAPALRDCTIGGTH